MPEKAIEAEIVKVGEASITPTAKEEFSLAVPQTAGTLQLAKEEKAILYAPPKDEFIDIRPDGLIYYQWTEYDKRLREAFGSEWSLVPVSKPQYIKEQNLVLWGFSLIIKGKFCGTAYGSQEYIASNRMMNYGDAIEGAKSNALMRLCKGLGMCHELWDKEFVEAWKKKNAVQNGGKWYKKGNEQKTQEAPTLNPQDLVNKIKEDFKATEIKKPVSVEENAYKTLMDRFAKAKATLKKDLGDDTEYYEILASYKLDHANQIKNFVEAEEILKAMSTAHKALQKKTPETKFSKGEENATE